MLPTGHFSPNPWPLLGLACVCSCSATKRLAHRSFSTKRLTSAIKKKKQKTKQNLIPTCTCRPTCYVPPWLHAHTLTHAGLLNTPTLPIPSPRVTGVITIPFFSQRQARKDDRNCVRSQKTGLNWFRRGKKLSCVFFSCL